MRAYPKRITIQLRHFSLVSDSGRKDYGVFARTPVQIPEFGFLYNKKKWAVKSINWTGNVATANSIGVTNDISTPLFSSLMEISKPSLVGKNEQTVLDKTVRRSHEILHNQIQLDPKFSSTISAEIQKLALILGHPTKVVAKLHKLVMYKEGDFFAPHVDSPHDNTEPMIFTASVQLPVLGWNSGGELTFGEDEEIPAVSKGTVGLALFYHDQRHSVSKVERGSRLSLVFDVVDSGIPNPDFCATDANAAFNKVRSAGFNNVAIQSSYCYLVNSEQVTVDQLKGSDKVFCDTALAAGAKSIEICLVYENNDGNIFRKEVLALMQVDKSFRSLYRNQREYEEECDEEECDEEECDEEECDEEAEEERGKKEKEKEQQFADESETKLRRPWVEDGALPSPLYEEGPLVAVKDEYRLGDTLFLATVAPKRLEYAGDEEVHLGNEGFFGKIFSNLAIIAHF